MADMLLYPVPLDSGYTALVRPLPPFVRQMLLAQATAQHPDPDGEPYRRPLENAFEEGLLEAPEDNPEYVKAVTLVRQQRLSAFYNQVLKADVVAGVEECDREALIAANANYLAELRKLTPDALSDDWQAVVFYVLIATPADGGRIAEAATQTVTQKGIRRAGAIFRR
jgi:hypothetical protein